MAEKQQRNIAGLQSVLHVALGIVDAELPLFGPASPQSPEAFTEEDRISDRLMLRREAFIAVLREMLDKDWVIDPGSALLERKGP